MERSTVGSLLRSTQAWCSQLCDKQTLDYGIAYYSQRFADLPEANQFREVLVEDASKWPAAFDEAEDWFRRRGLICHRWAPAGGTPTDAMRSFLSERGFHPVESTAMLLTEWVEIEPPGDVRVLPARAMRGAYRKTFLTAGEPPACALHADRRAPGDPMRNTSRAGTPPRGDVPPPASDRQRELLADAYDERLDDPQFDMFVAMVDQQPAGRCALYQVGDIGRVMDLSVVPGFEDRGVQRALTAFVLSMAQRLALPLICVQVDRRDAAKQAWFEQAGFVPDGTITEFVRESGAPGVSA